MTESLQGEYDWGKRSTVWSRSGNCLNLQTCWVLFYSIFAQRISRKFSFANGSVFKKIIDPMHRLKFFRDKRPKFEMLWVSLRSPHSGRAIIGERAGGRGSTMRSNLFERVRLLRRVVLGRKCGEERWLSGRLSTSVGGWFTLKGHCHGSFAFFRS